MTHESAGTLTLGIAQHSTFTKNLTWKDENDAVIDLSSYTAKLQVRAAPDGTVLLELTTENGGIAVAATEPNIVLTIAAATTAALTWGEASYDLVLVAPSGTRRRLLEGRAFVLAGITEFEES